MQLINIDYGEEIDFLDDDLVLRIAAYCNISCGYHAGDVLTIKKSIEACLRHGIKIGAHPSYQDKVNFGRVNSAASPSDLYYQLIHQLAGFSGIAQALNAEVYHVKAHGALYNHMMSDPQVAEVFLDAALEIFPNAKIFLMPGTVMEEICQIRGITFLREGFGDRRYQDRIKLMPRSVPGAVIQDLSQIKKQFDDLISGFVDTNDEGRIPLDIDTICYHGDNPAINQILISLDS